MIHPTTGDEVSRGEWFSWKAQGLFRHWWFIISITIGSVIWWVTLGFGWDRDFARWNAWASLMALIIESIVGMAMFAQTQRDALILREIRNVVDKVAAMEARILEDVEDIEESLEKED